MTHTSGKDIMEILTAFQQSQVLVSACSLGVFDTIHSSQDPVSADILANRLCADSDCLERLLNTCVCMGLLEKDTDENGVAHYRNVPAAEQCLVNTSAMSMIPLVKQNKQLYGLFGKLEDAVKYGRCQMPMGPADANGIFKQGGDLYFDDEKQQEFMQCMHNFSRMDAPHILNTFDFNEFETVCDLGGGSGALAMEFATWFSQMHVTMMDLPHVVTMASRFLPKTMPMNLVLRPGDFFKDDLPEADLFILSHILHSWDEDKIDLLLTKVFNSLRPGGAVLILEKTLNENKDGPLKPLLFDLGFLLLGQGRERTEDEYRVILERNNFCDVAIRKLPEMCMRDAILGRKL